MKYKRGDVVYIRELRDMIEAFGQQSDGTIPCAGSFVPKMFHTCGTPVTIAIADSNSQRYKVREYPDFVFSDDMLTEWTKYDALIHKSKALLAKSLSQEFNLSYTDVYNWLNGDTLGHFVNTQAKPIVLTKPSSTPSTTAEKINDLTKDENVFNSIQDYDFSSVLNSSQWEWNLS